MNPRRICSPLRRMWWFFGVLGSMERPGVKSWNPSAKNGMEAGEEPVF